MFLKKEIQELGSTHAPNLANTRAGVPDASRISTGKSGLCCLITGYCESMNSLLEDDVGHAHDDDHEVRYPRGDTTHRVPADGAPDCEQRTRISRRAGDSAFVNDMVNSRLTLGGSEVDNDGLCQQL